MMSEQKTRLGSLSHAGDFNEGQRLDAKSPTRRAQIFLEKALNIGGNNEQTLLN